MLTKVSPYTLHVMRTPRHEYAQYGHFPKISIRNPGTMVQPYKYLISGHFPKINTSYQGTLGTTYKYLIYGHFIKFYTSYQARYYMVIF